MGRRLRHSGDVSCLGLDPLEGYQVHTGRPPTPRTGSHRTATDTANMFTQGGHRHYQQVHTGRPPNSLADRDPCTNSTPTETPAPTPRRRGPTAANSTPAETHRPNSTPAETHRPNSTPAGTHQPNPTHPPDRRAPPITDRLLKLSDCSTSHATAINSHPKPIGRNFLKRSQ